MKRRADLLWLATIAAFTLAGALLIAGWFFLRGARVEHAAQAGVVATSGSRAAVPYRTHPSRGTRTAGESVADDIDELRDQHLRVPIEDADVERWKGSFAEMHNGHAHEAVDILAPRNTPIHAVDDGRVAKLFLSKAGGLTVYEIDPTQRFIFYYAHLQRYADNVRQGNAVARGDIIGYVGTSGDAPPDTPHLHFAIFRVADPKRWWQGTAIDPYLVFETTR